MVWLSVHQYYQYHYTTINQVISLLSKEEQEELYQIVLEICEPTGFGGRYRLFSGDTTSTFHSYSECLEDRGFVYNAMEQISFQKKIKVGYRYSYINISGRANLSSPHWSMPCSIERVKTSEKSEDVLIGQVISLLHQGIFSKDQLNILTLDSGYGTPKYLGKLDNLSKENKDLGNHLVSIVALRRGRKVWESYKGDYAGLGSPQIYGSQYYLKDETEGEKIGLGQKRPNQVVMKSYTNSKGKPYLIEVSSWKQMKLRTSDGVDMKQVEFTVVRVRQIAPQTGEIKGRPLWLAVHGKQKEEIDLWDIFQLYKCRFDIEHYFRFGKQRLLLNDYQTPEVEHYNTWHRIVGIAYWFLFAASLDVEQVTMPWESKKKEEVQDVHPPQRKTPAQTQKGMELFISSFENLVTIPKTRNKGKGRKAGSVMTKKVRHQVVRKGKKGSTIPKNRPG